MLGELDHAGDESAQHRENRLHMAGSQELRRQHTAPREGPVDPWFDMNSHSTSELRSTGVYVTGGSGTSFVRDLARHEVSGV